MAVGTTVAMASGIYEAFTGEHSMLFMDAAMILVFITLGKWLESLAKGRASQAIRRLLDLAPVEASVIRDGQTIVVPVSSVRQGETIVVPPGQRVPLDARVVSGVSTVDQSWLTGESRCRSTSKRTTRFSRGRSTALVRSRPRSPPRSEAPRSTESSNLSAKRNSRKRRSNGSPIAS